MRTNLKRRKTSRCKQCKQYVIIWLRFIPPRVLVGETGKNVQNLASYNSQWLPISPSPSSGDVIYEQPLTKGSNGGQGWLFLGYQTLLCPSVWCSKLEWTGQVLPNLETLPHKKQSIVHCTWPDLSNYCCRWPTHLWVVHLWWPAS